MRETSPRPVAVVGRAVAILNLLAQAPTDLGTNEIARRTGTNASSASRMLATLADAQLVHRSAETGRYRLGLRLVQLGSAALARLNLRDLAHPHLVALMEATGETATLSVPGDGTAITVDFVQSSSSVRSVASVGRPSIAHATAIGKVVLAYDGCQPPSDLPAYTEHTITDPEELAKVAGTVRKHGWAQALQEREHGLNAVAAPVLDVRGELIAVLGLQGPAWRFDGAALEVAVSQLLEHAAALSPGAER